MIKPISQSSIYVLCISGVSYSLLGIGEGCQGSNPQICAAHLQLADKGPSRWYTESLIVNSVMYLENATLPAL
jgi:hypothetical protein